MTCVIVVRSTMAVIYVSTCILLASCEGAATDQNASSRYRMTSQFTDNREMLAVERSSDGSYTLAFKPWVNPYVNPYGNEVLDREWVIKSVGDDVYRITNRGLGEELSLAVADDGVFDQVELARSGDVSSQRWKISTLDNGYCTFTTELLGIGMALDVTSETDVSMLAILPAGDFHGQHWQLSQIGMGGMLDDACSGIVR